MIEIIPITADKKRFLDLLLLGDEQESMIDRYLEQSEVFALYDNGPRSICAVLDLGEGTVELKNIATYPQFQDRGYGTALIAYLFDHYKGRTRKMLVGTGETPAILSFYKRCGFELSHRIPNFFTDHYDHPIIEDGIQLVDMIYLKKEF